MIRYYHKSVKSKSLKELPSHKPGSWIYVEKPSDKEADELAEKFKLNRGFIEDARDENEMPRLDKEGSTVYIFTRFAYSDKESQITTAPLLFVIAKDLFITISPVPLPRLNRFVSGDIEVNTTQRTKLLLQIMDQIVDQYETFLNKIGRQIKMIRSRLRVEEIQNRDFIRFVEIEDDLNEFLSALAPTNSILRRLLRGKHVPLYAEDEDIVEDLLLNNEQSIEASRATLKSIANMRDAYATIMSNNLNRVIRILTFATVLLAVPTLVGSIYGMNINLPFADDEHTFLGVVLFSLLITALLIAFFRRKRWL